MKKIVLFAAMIALVFTGCSKDETVGSNNDSNAIGFNVLGSKDEVISRATGTLAANFNNFLVWANWNDGTAYTSYIDRQYVEKVSAAWSYSPIKYWPSTGTVDFYAYSPAASINATFTNSLVTPAAAASATIGYKVPANFKLQEDLLAAKVVGLDKDDVTATLAFNHILSQFVFNARGSKAGLTYVVEKIEFINILPEGTYNFFSSAWTASGTATDFIALGETVTASANTNPTAVNVAYSATDWTSVTSDEANTALFLIPGSWTNATGAILRTAKPATGGYIAFKYSIKDGAGFELNTNCVVERTVYIPILAADVPATNNIINTRYVYNIELGDGLTPISFSASSVNIANSASSPIVK